METRYQPICRSCGRNHSSLWGRQCAGNPTFLGLAGVAKPVLTETQKRVRTARRVLAGRGLTEAVTWSFIPKPLAKLFGGGSDQLDLGNPISTEMSSMRPSLVAGVITALGRNNDRGFSDLALFEIGQSYQDDTPEGQRLTAAGVRSGTAKSSGSLAVIGMVRQSLLICLMRKLIALQFCKHLAKIQ